jgi:hypothetical protein
MLARLNDKANGGDAQTRDMKATKRRLRGEASGTRAEEA